VNRRPKTGGFFMETILINYLVTYAPAWVPGVGALVLLLRIVRVLSKSLPDIIEHVTQIRALHERTLRELREVKSAHNALHERVEYIESNCLACSQNRRRHHGVKNDS
jgi:hypothetical protein